MPRASIASSHEAVQALREAHHSLGETISAQEIDLVDLGKAVEILIRNSHATMKAAGRQSMRLAAAERSLSLKTSKSDLTAFLEATQSEEPAS